MLWKLISSLWQLTKLEESALTPWVHQGSVVGLIEPLRGGSSGSVLSIIMQLVRERWLQFIYSKTNVFRNFPARSVFGLLKNSFGSPVSTMFPPSKKTILSATAFANSIS